MPNDSAARYDASIRADGASARLHGNFWSSLDIESVLDESQRATPPLDQVLGPLAALLVAKWAGYDESEREAIADFDEKAFTPELPDALRLPAWDRPVEAHAGAVADALNGMSARSGEGGAPACYVTRVAPVVTRAVERSRPLFERLHAWVHKLDLGTPEGRSLAACLFDDALRGVVDRQGRLVGEFTTPERVADLMLELANPEPGEKVYDPCFGFGELLVGAVRRMRAAVRTNPLRGSVDVGDSGVFGVELDRTSYVVGLCRTLLAGVDCPFLELGDALRRPPPRNETTDGFDCILAAPPWGVRTSRTSAGQFPFPSRNTESLFLQHVMANLRLGGRAVVALPESMLFRSGERRVRKALLSDCSVDAVVSLPAGAFAPWTGISVSLLLFRRAVPRSTVRFVSISPKVWEAAPDGFDNRDDVHGECRDIRAPGQDRLDPGVFAGGLGAGAGAEDGGGFGSGIESGAGLRDGSGAGGEAGSGVGLRDGTGYGNGGMSRIELLRGVSELIRHRPELPADGFLPGVEAWEVSVREIARRSYELVPKKSGDDTLAAEMDRLALADPSLRIERLEHIAEVYTGQSYQPRYTTRICGAAEAVAGLIRVGDVGAAVDARDSTEGARAADFLTPSRCLTGEGKARVKENEILRPLDIVVTTWGTVGKIGLLPVPDASMDVEVTSAPTVSADGLSPDTPSPSLPLVAANGVAVLRVRGGVTPQFLAALLRSPVYQSWLSGHARGTTIQHLTIRTLRRLRVPVPPVPVQEAVLGELAGSRGDAMAALVRLLSGAATDPVERWLEEPFVARLASGNAIGNYSDRFRALLNAADALQSLVARTPRPSDLPTPEIGGRRAGAWLAAVGQAAAALNGLVSIPRGAGRLAVLEAALSRLHQALHLLNGAEGSKVDRLRSFTRGMVELSEEEVRKMQEAITLDIGLEPAEVTIGTASEVRLRLTNSSTVPVRSLIVETRPPVGEARIPYLADGESHDFPLTVHPRDATQPFLIAVSWHGRRLDGTPVRREAEVSLRVLSTREAARFGDLGSSPYIVGSPVPVDRQEMFFGRADVMERIKRQLGAHTHANVLLLEGNRRTGKTSILRQLGKAGALPGWVPVYCSFQDAEGDDTRSGISTRNVFRLLARTTGWALYDAGMETWFPGLPARDPQRPFKLAFRTALNQAFADEHSFETFELYIAAALQAASPRRVLLMLDEFDKLQEGIDSGITSPQVPENIRHLLQHQPGLSAIITGSRRLKRLREEYWSALFGLGYRIGISALPDDEARRLVTQPLEGRLSYLPQARDRLVDLCACHPFLVQSLCNRVFEQAVSGGERTITPDIVERAANEMVRDNEHFRTLWGYAGSERRRLLLALCSRLADEPDAINLDLLGVKLHERGVPLRYGSALADDITELRELELLDFDETFRGGTYRLSAPLMAKWLRTNVDFDDLTVRAKQEAMEASQ